MILFILISFFLHKRNHQEKNNMAKILITGANGQLGNEFREISQNSAHTFVFTDVQELNITSDVAVQEFVRAGGFDVVVNGSRAHLPQAQARYGTSLLPICLQVSPAILRQRLQARGRESETEIAARLERAARYAPYDCHVLNNDGSLLQSVDTLLALMGRKEKKHVCL